MHAVALCQINGIESLRDSDGLPPSPCRGASVQGCGFRQPQATRSARVWCTASTYPPHVLERHGACYQRLLGCCFGDYRCSCMCFRAPQTCPARATGPLEILASGKARLRVLGLALPMFQKFIESFAWWPVAEDR